MNRMSPVSLFAPSSKSLSHRVVIAASLARGVSHVQRVLESDDLERTIDIMRLCGAEIERKGPGHFVIAGMGGSPGWASPQGTPDMPLSCFVGESGTTCRLLAAILAAGKGSFRIHGAGRMHQRPMGDIFAALKALGASIHCEQKADHAPCVITSSGLSMKSVAEGWLSVGCDESSQYLSGLLLAAPVTEEGLSIELGGSKTVSWPYVGLTFQILETFGVPFTVTSRDTGPEAVQGTPVWRRINWREIQQAVPHNLRFHLTSSGYQATDTEVEGDYSGASYLLAAGALGKRPVTVKGLRQDSLQGDAAILDILARMGAGVNWSSAGVTISPSPLQGIDIDMSNCPDLVPTVAILATRAQTATTIRNVAHLRIKESDRIAAPVAELAKIGCYAEATSDGLVVTPLPSGAAPRGEVRFSSHGDHRIAMSIALLELGEDVVVTLDDPGCVAKSYPGFWDDWAVLRPESQAGTRP